jgi:predicted esterase
MPDVTLGFVHRYIPPADGRSRVTLLLLHGTGGDENDLLPVGAVLAPVAGILSPRGKVLENSNGANIAGSLLLRRPDLLAAVVLFRPMAPFVPEEPPDLAGKPVFLAAGRRDTIVPAEETERVERLYKGYGADVSLHWRAHGHELEEDDVLAARDWLSGWMTGTGS